MGNLFSDPEEDFIFYYDHRTPNHMENLRKISNNNFFTKLIQPIFNVAPLTFVGVQPELYPPLRFERKRYIRLTKKSKIKLDEEYIKELIEYYDSRHLYNI